MKSDSQVKKHVFKTVMKIIEDKHYEVYLPWDLPPLPDNSSLVKKRLANVIKKLLGSKLYKEYEKSAFKVAW